MFFAVNFIFAEIFPAFCTRISKGNTFEQCQIPCKVGFEDGYITLTYPYNMTLTVQSFDSKKNGVTNYTCKDSQGKLYGVHISENPFEKGTLILNISDANGDKIIWGYVLAVD